MDQKIQINDKVKIDFDDDHVEYWWLVFGGEVYYSWNKEQLEDYVKVRLEEKIPYSANDRFKYDVVYSEPFIQQELSWSGQYVFFHSDDKINWFFFKANKKIK